MDPMEFAGPDRRGPVVAAAPIAAAGRAQALTEAWHGWIAAACGLDETAFQLVLGTCGAAMNGTTGLMRLADMRVRPGPAVLLEPASRPTWSHAYLELLHALQPLGEHGLRGFLGGLHENWIACRNAAPSGTGHDALFRVWAENHLSPERARRARLIFAEGLSDPLCQAFAAYAAPGFRHIAADGTSLPGFTGDKVAAAFALQNAPRLAIDFDTDRLSGTIATTVGRNGRPPRLRYFQTRQPRSGEELRRLDGKALEHRITVEGHAARVALMSTSPLGWLAPCEFARAWNAEESSPVWEPAAGRDAWSRFFGPGGSLACRVGRLLLASGVEIDVTSHAVWHRDEVDVIRSEATGGVWPLMPLADRPEHVVRVRHNPDGSVTHRLSLPADRFVALGAMTVPAPF